MQTNYSAWVEINTGAIGGVGGCTREDFQAIFRLVRDKEVAMAVSVYREGDMSSGRDIYREERLARLEDEGGLL